MYHTGSMSLQIYRKFFLYGHISGKISCRDPYRRHLVKARPSGISNEKRNDVSTDGTRLGVSASRARVHRYASTDVSEDSARTVGGRVSVWESRSVCTDGNGVTASRAGGHRSVSTTRYGIPAESVRDLRFVSTERCANIASRAGGDVSTDSKRITARCAWRRRSVSITGIEHRARSAKGRRSASISGNGFAARSASFWKL